MRLELTARHLDITPSIRRLIDAKLAKLERLLNDSAVSAQAVLTREKYRHRAEITLHARGEKFLHGVGSAANWEASVSQAVDKILQQAQKVKGKWEGRRRDTKGAPIVPAGDGTRAAAAVKPARARTRVRMPPILRAERQPIKSMSVTEAAREVDAGGDGVVVFRDADTTSISVLYRRPNGELTLLETES